jgi:hypothetical protein
MKISFDTPPCTRVLAFSALAVLAVCCAGSCDNENQPTGIGPRYPYGVLLGATGCKLFAEPSEGFDAPSNRDCVAWTYAADGTLMLKHVNAGFNCCPGEITADITISGNAITIVEHERMGGCRCLCLFDVNYKVFKLPAGTYTIRFVELYEIDDPPLAVTVDLASNPTGSFCVPRTHYPWHDPDGSQAEPAGRIVSTLDCGTKEAATPAFGQSFPRDMSCASYRYGDDNVLRITHENAGFNCCAGAISADISVENGVITIAEREDRSDCDCACLWDVSYEIANVPPGSYTVRFVEPYRNAEDEALEFPIDLASAPSGIACAGRVRYPWTHDRTREEDWLLLDRLRDFILGYIGSAPCSGDGECRHIAFGAKPCGGPWRYLVYSTRNVDPDLLADIVSRHNAVNAVFNRRWRAISDCSLPPVPRAGCALGSCVDLDNPPR